MAPHAGAAADFAATIAAADGERHQHAGDKRPPPASGTSYSSASYYAYFWPWTVAAATTAAPGGRGAVDGDAEGAGGAVAAAATTSKAATPPPTTTVPHVQQLHAWDCGVACAMMILQALRPQALDEAAALAAKPTRRNNNAAPAALPPPQTDAGVSTRASAAAAAALARHHGALCTLMGRTTSVWTIDVAHLLARLLPSPPPPAPLPLSPAPALAPRVTLCTTTVGVDPRLAAEPFYAASLDADTVRVRQLFASAAKAGVDVRRRSLPAEELAALVSGEWRPSERDLREARAAVVAAAASAAAAEAVKRRQPLTLLQRMGWDSGGGGGGPSLSSSSSSSSSAALVATADHQEDLDADAVRAALPFRPGTRHLAIVLVDKRRLLAQQQWGVVVGVAGAAAGGGGGSNGTATTTAADWFSVAAWSGWAMGTTRRPRPSADAPTSSDGEEQDETPAKRPRSGGGGGGAAEQRQQDEEEDDDEDGADLGFVGHFLLLTGYDARRRHFLAHDPARKQSSGLPWRLPAAALDAARFCRGTDEDVLLVPVLS